MTGEVQSNTILFKLGSTSGLRYHLSNPSMNLTNNSASLKLISQKPWVKQLGNIISIPSLDPSLEGKVRDILDAMKTAENTESLKIMSGVLDDYQKNSRDGLWLKENVLNILWDLLWRAEHTTEAIISHSENTGNGEYLWYYNLFAAFIEFVFFSVLYDVLYVNAYNL